LLWSLSQSPRQLKIGAQAFAPIPIVSIDMLPDERVMEPVVSTLSEIAANLLKRERMAESTGAGVETQASGWEQLMAIAKESDIHKWQAALNQHIADNPGKRRVTMLRVIEGGMA
jgi:hypothetical protein